MCAEMENATISRVVSNVCACLVIYLLQTEHLVWILMSARGRQIFVIMAPVLILLVLTSANVILDSNLAKKMIVLVSYDFYF
jgi:uncharacterized membrane protein YwzB